MSCPVFVLPRFAVFFESLHATLPLPTRMLLAVTDFLTDWWWALLGGAAGIALIIFAVVRTQRGRYARDQLLLKVPVLGHTIQYALVERFSRILSSIFNASTVAHVAQAVMAIERQHEWTSQELELADLELEDGSL